MKCTLCGAPTDILSTRQRDGNPVRVRRCFNNHRFTTTESFTRLLPERNDEVRQHVSEVGGADARSSE